jgi:hypothetical protein
MLDELYLQGRGHSGVIFVNRRWVPEGNVGVLVGALIRYWRSEQEQDWTNRTAYLPVYQGYGRFVRPLGLRCSR